MLSNTKTTIGTIAHMPLGIRGAEEFTWSWSQMIEFNADYLCAPNERVFYTRAAVTYHSFARDMLAKQMRGDWILMLDTDHRFEPDLAHRMLRIFEMNQLDVLTGLYVYKGEPHPPVLYTRNPDGMLSILGAWDVPEGDGPYLVPIASAGGGCLMIRRSVFQRIEKELKESPFGPRGSFSEDHAFFDRCHALKIPAYCCPTIESYHLGTQSFGLQDFHVEEQVLGPRIEVAR